MRTTTTPTTPAQLGRVLAAQLASRARKAPMPPQPLRVLSTPRSKLIVTTYNTPVAYVMVDDDGPQERVAYECLAYIEVSATRGRWSASLISTMLHELCYGANASTSGLTFV